jgi:putative Mn2+ efflux pump MntP
MVVPQGTRVTDAHMGIGTSIFLIALGAILAFAVNADVSGLEISTIGIILMVCGVLGLLISLLFTSMWRDRAAARGGTVVRDRTVEREPLP